MLNLGLNAIKIAEHALVLMKTNALIALNNYYQKIIFHLEDAAIKIGNLFNFFKIEKLIVKLVMEF